MELRELVGFHIEGYVKMYDPINGEVYFDGRNAIHYENFSIAMANSVANNGSGAIYQLAFGNGGTMVDPTGVIIYLTPNTTGTNAGLYNQTYIKIVDDRSSRNPDPTRNYMETRHVTGTNYTDVFITCLLDFGEPYGQSAFDNAINNNDSFVYDEIGLVAAGSGALLTHLIFHPINKALNRLIQIDYTVRIHSLTGLVGV
jgi:hypothetical protein